MMATFMGFYLFFGVKPHVWMDIGLLMMFYALYYGVMARDVAEICTEKMVSGIGVSTIKRYPKEALHPIVNLTMNFSFIIFIVL